MVTPVAGPQADRNAPGQLVERRRGLRPSTQVTVVDRRHGGAEMDVLGVHRQRGEHGEGVTAAMCEHRTESYPSSSARRAYPPPRRTALAEGSGSSAAGSSRGPRSPGREGVAQLPDAVNGAAQRGEIVRIGQLVRGHDGRSEGSGTGIGLAQGEPRRWPGQLTARSERSCPRVSPATCDQAFSSETPSAWRPTTTTSSTSQSTPSLAAAPSRTGRSGMRRTW